MKRLRCWLLRKKLFDYAIGELIKSDADKIKKHLNVCSRCKQYVHLVQKIGKIAHQEEQLFLNEVFWRKFDERLDLTLAGQGMRKAGFNIRLIPGPRHKLALATAIAVSVLLVFTLTPLRDYFIEKGDVRLAEQELIETALLIEDEAEVYLNSDEDAYIEEILLQLELDDA